VPYAPSFTDPAGSNALVAAVLWLQGTLLGTIATTVAVIAVATIGFMMLSGSLNLRYGARVILGCFILFGASSIAAGIQAAAAAAAGGGDRGPGGATLAVSSGSPLPITAMPSATKPAPPNNDPYAGAAVPSR
jgi:type IV secretory pathway VirB2 component (pilin)